MCLTIQDALSLDIDYLYGQSWSVREDDLKAHEEQINRAAKEVSEIRRNGKGPDGSHVFFPHLPYLYEENLLIGDDEKQRIKTLSEKAKEMDAVVSIGIGGSYLGNQPLLEHEEQGRKAWVSSRILCRAECRSGQPFETDGRTEEKKRGKR